VEHSVLSPGVYVEAGARVRDSIVMGDSQVGRDALVNRAIVDKEVRIGEARYVGLGRVTRR